MAKKFVEDVKFNNSQGESVFTMDPDSSLVQVGGGGIDGAIHVFRAGATQIGPVPTFLSCTGSFRRQP
jgi:hypothetical protein